MQQLKFIFITLVMLGLISMAYSYFQVRSGRWTHIDASAQGERKSLNMFLATLCLLSAGIVWSFINQQMGEVVAAYGLRCFCDDVVMA